MKRVTPLYVHMNLFDWIISKILDYVPSDEIVGGINVNDLGNRLKILYMYDSLEKNNIHLNKL